MPAKDEYVPMFWGPSKWGMWNQRVAEMKMKTPKHLMAFNEPDVKSQSNMDAGYAAKLYMEQIYPWASKGVKLGSPAIVWDLNWMASFLSALNQKGGHVDYICIHWFAISSVSLTISPLIICAGTDPGRISQAFRNTFKPHTLASTRTYGLLKSVSPPPHTLPKVKSKLS